MKGLLKTLTVGVVLFSTPWISNCQRPYLRFDFETGDLQGWQVMEGRFGALISDRAMSRNSPGRPYPKQGRYYLTTTELPDGGFDDDMVGVVESPVIKLAGERISLRVGGGGHPETYVALCTEDGREVRVARGVNSEVMEHVVWHVPELVGKRVFLAVVDRRKGSWGHVTLDAIELEGVLDQEATARVRRNYERRKERRMKEERRQGAVRARERARHRQQLQDPRYLFGRGRTRVYSAMSLDAIAIPVGGIGAGCIQMDGQGRIAVWQILGNYRPATVTDCLFAIRYVSAHGRPVVRALQGVPSGPFPPMKTVRFRGEYPFGWWTMTDWEIPVRVELEVFSPLIPGSLRDSAMPCAVFRITLTNTGKTSASVHLLALQQNILGLSPENPPLGLESASYGGNVNTVVQQSGLTMVRMSHQHNKASVVLASTGQQVSPNAQCGTVEDVYGLLTQQEEPVWPNVMAEAVSPEGRSVNGGLLSSLHLAPGQSANETVILTWYAPNQVHGEGAWRAEGCMYENRWPDAVAVVREVKERLPELYETTRLYHDTLYASNLPVWLIDRISSQVAVLRSKTCFWGRNGYFGVWEGCNPDGGCCAGNCSHVWHYAQAHARLWPELGRLMREQELRHITDDGAIPHRQPDAPPAFDGQCGTILGAYREHLCSGDASWLRTHWPALRKAMEYLIRRWDADEDGLLKGPQWNTLDENAGGTSSWLGSLYIAALRASAAMARAVGDEEARERYDRIADTASPNQNAALFNGEYYIQIPEPTPYRDYGPGCHIDQLLGQWWADMLNLGRIFPEDRSRTALAALHRHNFLYDFVDVPQAPRKFVHDDDAGTKMITWPRGGRPPAEHQMLYADEVMTGFEYAAAATMISHGLLTEGFRTARAVADRYDGRLRTGLSGGNFTSWGYSGNPFGDDECGKFYGRSMSSWSLLLACQGFIYDGPAGLLGFRPQWRPENHASFFTVAEGWGLFRQTRTAKMLRASIELRCGQVRLTKLVLKYPGASQTTAEVRLGKELVPCQVRRENEDVYIDLAREITLRAGDMLSVTLSRTKDRPNAP